MRLGLPFVVVLLCAQAQAEDAAASPDAGTPVAASSAPLACAAENDCGEGMTCLKGFCAPATGGFFDRLTLSLGLGTFGEMFPSSSQKLADGSRGQLSLLGGARFWIGTHLPNRFRLLAVIEFGVGASGTGPSKGSQGILEGAGLEVSLEYFKLLKPFVRFIYNAVVLTLRNGDGTLAPNAYFVSAGARIWLFELHLSIGRDFAGGVSPGFGLSINWLY